MKKYVLNFIKRGLMLMGFGPFVLAIVYGILGAAGAVTSLGVGETVLAIVTVSFMAFIAAGITVVYQIEELPLMYALLLHGVVLYLDYAAIYLINGWLADGVLPYLIFTVCFVLGYALVWGIVYLCIRKDAEKINRKLKSGQADH